MTDTDDAQIKAEIDGIMKGVKTIMQKIDALTPEEEQEQIEDADKNPSLSEKRNSGAS